MRVDLASEYADAGRSARLEHYQRLEALGCSRRALASLAPANWPFGAARVRGLGDGLYEPDPEGLASVIMPVTDAYEGVFIPEPYDLIAWQTGNPRRWWWRTGSGLALGEYLIDQCDILPVVETPLDWLAQAGNALCILDWHAPASFWSNLRTGPRLAVQTEDLRRKLRLALSRYVQLPDMEVGLAS